MTPRLSVNAGLRWEYVGSSFDSAGTIGNVWPSLLKQVPVPPLAGTLVGNVVAANYNPALRNPYTGQAFGPPPAGVLTGPTRSFYQNSTPLGRGRSAVGLCVAAVWSGRARVRPRWLRVVLPGANLQRQRWQRTFVYRAAVCPGIHQYRRQPTASRTSRNVSDHHAGLCSAHPHLPALRPDCRAGIQSRLTSAMEPKRPDTTARGPHI